MPSFARKSAFSPQELVNRLESEELARKVARQFLQLGALLIAPVQVAVAEQDSVALARAAHALKGVVGYVSPAAAELVMRLEAEAKAGNLLYSRPPWPTTLHLDGTDRGRARPLARSAPPRLRVCFSWPSGR